MTSGPAAQPACIRFTPDREELVAVPGGRAYVRIDGDLNGPRPPLVLIHGGPGSAHWYFLPATTLADERAIILYDQLDSGRSDMPGDPANWEVARFVEELEAIRAHLGIARWHVLGQSWGGTIALEYGAAHQDKLASLILQSAFIETEAWLADVARLRDALPERLRGLLERCDVPGALSAEDYEEAIDGFERHHIKLRPPAPELEAYRAALPISFNKTIYQHMWGRAEFTTTGTLNGYDGTSLLDHLDGGSTLFVAGEHDEATPATLARFAARAHARFAEIPDAAHILMNDNPLAYLALLRPWLAEHDA